MSALPNPLPDRRDSASKVTIVIPNWNGSGLLATLLPSLARQRQPIDEVIVVDNGSTDDSAAIATRAGARVIKMGSNTGFSHAVNCGIRASGTDWIAIVNNDVELEPGWLASLMERARAPSAWFAAGKLLDARQRDRIDGSFDAVCRGGCAWRCGNGRKDEPLWSREREVQFAPFTAALFRAELFERVGFLDEQFESYLEDIDFGIRCASAGLHGVYVPEAVAYHQGSATLGRWHPDTVRMISRNQLLLVAKHYPPKWIFRYGWPVFVAQALWGFTALRHGSALAYLKGKWEGWRLFQSARGKPAPTVPSILERSEREIRELQRQSGFDLYWRIYFALT